MYAQTINENCVPYAAKSNLAHTVDQTHADRHFVPVTTHPTAAVNKPPLSGLGQSIEDAMCSTLAQLLR